MHDLFNYYKRRSLDLINLIEDKTNTLFHEKYPDLETRFWLAIDSNDKRQLMRVNLKLTKILDDLSA